MIKFKDIFPADIVSVQGHPYMFSNARIDRETIPEGFVVYDVGDDCDGEFWRIRKIVRVNHWATIIGVDEVEYNCDDNTYYCDPISEKENLSSEGWFTGDYVESSDEFCEELEWLRDNAK